MMNKVELAKALNGREYGSEMTREEELQAREARLIVVTGYSDDNMELHGLWQDEFGCYNGGIAHITPKGLFYSECEDESCPYARKEMQKHPTIKAVWHDDGGPCWTYETDIPHETFNIYEDGELFCVGIIFAVSDMEAPQ